MRRIMAGMLAVGLAASTASAQLIVNPVGKVPAGKFEVGAALLMSSIEYEGEGGGSGDVDRMILGGYGTFGINDMFDAYGTLSYSFKSEPEDADGADGSGFILSGGVRAKVFAQNQLGVFAYGFLQYVSETYEYSYYGRKHDVDATVLELGGGALVSFQVMPELTVYGGLELVPYSDGETDAEGSGGKGDVERDTIFTLRGGATYNMGDFWLRGELALGGETAFLAGAGMSF